MRLVGKRHAHVFRLAAGITTGQMRVAEESGRGVAEHLVAFFLVAVRPLADGVILAATLVAFATEDGEGNDNSFALAQRAIHAAAGFDDFAHELVPENVSLLELDHEVIVKVKVAPADRGAGYFNDGIARMLDCRIGDIFNPNIFFAVPT